MIRSRVYVTSGLIAVTIGVGVLGYRLIEGWGWLDAFYMTVITLTTVGFGEVRPLSDAGRFFTILVILFGAGVVAYALSSTAEILASGQFARALQRRRRTRLKDHCIVCGFGRVGRFVAAELHREKVPFIVLDQSEEAVEACQELGYRAILGNAAQLDNLRRAGVQAARCLITAVDSDAENVFIILTVRETRDDILIIARCNYEDSEPKLRRAGADRVISPYALAGSRIAGLVSRPGVTDFLDVVLHSKDMELWLEEIVVDAGSEIEGQSLGETRLRNELGVTVLAIELPGSRVVAHPEADTPLPVGARLIVLGTREQLRNLERMASI